MRLGESASYEGDSSAPSPKMSPSLEHKLQDRSNSVPDIKNASSPGQLPPRYSEAVQPSRQEYLGLTAVCDPPDPIADIIFIHGLGGSSIKTWSWKHDPKNFWPAWLAYDDYLCKVRIHTYGFGSKIGGSNSMNIHDFAVDLLFKMKHEYIQDDETIGTVSWRPVTMLRHTDSARFRSSGPSSLLPTPSVG